MIKNNKLNEITCIFTKIYFQGEGAFAKKNISSNTIVAQYGGYRLDKSQKLPIQISNNEQYRHNIGLGNGVLDIPAGYESIHKYNGTMAHKLNHRFYMANCRTDYVRYYQINNENTK